MSNSAIRVAVHLSVRPGELDPFRKMVDELTNSVEAEEPGTRSYEWFLSDDGADCYLTEVYADSDGLMAHLAHIGPALGPLLAIAPTSEVLVFGSVNAQAKEALEGFGARLVPRVAGFAR